MSDSLAVDRRGRGAYVRFYDLTGVTQIKPGDKVSYFDYVPSKTKMVFSRGLVSHDYLPLIDDSEASFATEDIFVSGLKDYRKHFGNKVISRQHAILRWKPTQQCPVLTDIGSTHGTYVHKLGKGTPFSLLPRMIKTMKEPTRLEKGDPNMLEDGDVIFLGKSVVSGSETYHPTSLFVQVVPEAKDHALAPLARPRAPHVIDLDSGDDDKSGFREVSAFETTPFPLEKGAAAPLVTTLEITYSEADSEEDDDDDDDNTHVKSSEDPDTTMISVVDLQGEEDGDSIMEDESESEAQGYSESEEDSQSESESESGSDGEASENGEEEAFSDEKMPIIPGYAHEHEEEKKMSKMEDILDDVVDFLVNVTDEEARETEAGPFLADTDLRETQQEDDDEASEHGEDYTTSDHSQHGNKDDNISEASTAPTSDEEEASLTVKATNVVSVSDVASRVAPTEHASSNAQVAGKKRSRDELEEEEGEAPPTSDQPQPTSPAAGAPLGYKKFKTFTAGVAAGFAAGVIGTFVGLSSLALNDASFV